MCEKRGNDRIYDVFMELRVKEGIDMFTHLHVHTEYSLLDGSSKIPELVHQVKKLGMDSIAITDHGAMYGVINFYKAAKAEGVKPIIGCEVYVTLDSRFRKETLQGERRYYHLVLLAENDRGYHNLMKIVSRGFTEGFYYKPRVDYEVLEQYKEGLIALSACLAGEVASYLRENNYEKAKNTAVRLEKLFGKGNFFLELQDHGITDQTKVNTDLLKLSKETGIGLVATNDVHYTYKEDAEAHDILLCIQTGKKVQEEHRMRYEGGQYYLKSPAEMEELFPYAKEALKNTEKIANRCNVEIVFGEQKVPQYQVPEGHTSVSYLRYLCEKGIVKRYEIVTDELRSRMEYELKTIEHMGYVDYFLIVWDFIHYAREHDIAVGPGRGSAAGSIVSYCLEITNIDPIRYQLLFERFLNPERVSMPDIDVDFCYERRQEVIDYVVEKYGKDQVVQIVTFGTMSAKAVIRDVGRALDLPYAKVDRIAKAIPNELNITIDKALKQSPDFKKLYTEDKETKYLIDMSMRLEGLPRHTSIHAAGVVIGKTAIDEYVPLAVGGDGAVVTQFTMTTIEELGLLKMDFLGLRTLTVLQDAERMIQKKNASFSLSDIDFKDPKVYEMIGKGCTGGVFQLESAGMKSFMKELKPKNIEDVIAGISLYRPGPMDFIPKYIEGKEHQEKTQYDCEMMEEILESTYGCIVYQEQVMQIVMKLAGYTLGRSDLVRRAMSKKKAEVMAKERKNFVYGNEEEQVLGCIHNGIDEKTANHIWDEMLDFAKYAFNKSHAAAYADVAYQTAYLKCYYPLEFMAALLTSVSGNSDKIAEYHLELKQLGIELLPPDLNRGEVSFSVDDGGIRFGMSAIKSLGKDSAIAIIKERQNGTFLDLMDLAKRLSSKEINRRTLEVLIKSGACDSFPANRKQQLMVYVSVLDDVKKTKKCEIEGQMSFSDLFSSEQFHMTYPEVAEYGEQELLAMEKEVLGVYLSGHPLNEEADFIRSNVTAQGSDFMKQENGEFGVFDGGLYIIGGMIREVKKMVTKKGTTMAFLTLETLSGSVDVTVFPREYQENQKILVEDAKIFIRGTVQINDQRAEFLSKQLIPFSQVPKEIWMQFQNIQTFQAQEEELYAILQKHRGMNPIVIYCKQENKIKRLPIDYCMNGETEAQSDLYHRYGKDNICFRGIWNG